MGNKRPRPRRLAAKLAQVRTKLGLTQEEMRQRLAYGKDARAAGHISEFERDLREPPLVVLLHYARAAGVTMEMLVDDELDLPSKLPTKKNTGARTAPKPKENASR